MGLCVETHTGSSIADMKPYPRGGLILSDRGHPFFMTRTRSGLDRYPPPIGHRIPSIHDQLKQHLFEPLTINLNPGKRLRTGPSKSLSRDCRERTCRT